MQLRRIDHSTLWHPFTQMQAYAEENAPIIERGEGVRLYDTEGRQYFDGVSSLWCNVHGHRHPRIDAAIRDQLDRVAHSTLLGLGSVPSIRLAERLADLAGMPHVFYADSGAAAVEIAMKVAFQYMQRTHGSKRTKFVAFRNSYHGDTLGAVSVGGIDIFHSIFKPLLFETLFAPSPYTYRWPNDRCAEESLAAFDELLAGHADEIVAVIIEPMVQGAAGMIVQPPGFLAAVRRKAREQDVLFIADEVATGFGRTGRMFAVEHDDVRPDVLVLGKGITAGYLPLSAACFTSEIYESFLGRHEEFRHFLHGHTYTGNALACAAALASLDVFAAEKTLETLGDKIMLVREELKSLADHEHVGEIRQCGMMVGIELVADRHTKRSFDPAERKGHQVILEARRRGMIIRPLGDVIVFMPPLSSTEKELREMCGILKESIEETKIPKS
ncbi:MAG: adenosylmethionine--8-amino-7-oxononanoate transaminase [Candidatus Hydrogenedentota bacterium]